MKDQAVRLAVLPDDATAVRVPTSRAHCFDCPATRRGMLAELIGDDSACCQLESVAVEARETIPLRWFGRYSLGFVRRGTLVRQRTDSNGRAAAIDVVGQGSAFAIEERGGDDTRGTMASGYAVSRTLICVSTAASINQALVEGGQSALDLYRLSTEALRRMERLSDARSRSLVASRVAALLTTLADTLTPGTAGEALVPADFRQRDLAALLSIRHESVCRIMRDFDKRGLIEQSALGTRILQRQALDAI